MLQRPSVFKRFYRLSESLDGRLESDDEIEEDNVIDPHIMSEEEIMHQYWKISVSTIHLVFVNLDWCDNSLHTQH